MGLESATYLTDLVNTNPVSSDAKSQGDDHIRLIKAVLLSSFPGIAGAMTASHTELNILDGATLSTAELNILDGVTASTAELNILDGATLTTTELNYVDGVTSAIQTQLDLKAPLASPALTGTPTAPTATTGTSTTQIATTAFVGATAFSSALPAQTGNGGKLITTDGSTASWTNSLNVAVVSPSAGTAFATTTATQTLDEKTLTNPIFAAFADTTKKAQIVLSEISTGTTRNVTLADADMTLFTPGMRLLSTVSASSSATVDVETTFNSTYDFYMLIADGITVQTDVTRIQCRFKIGGSYLTTATYDMLLSDGSTSSSQTSAIVISALSNAATESVHFVMYIDNPESTTKHHSMRVLGCKSSSAAQTSKVVKNQTTGALTGIRFFMDSGNILTGNFRLYGVYKP